MGIFLHVTEDFEMIHGWRLLSLLVIFDVNAWQCPLLWLSLQFVASATAQDIHDLYWVVVDTLQNKPDTGV